MTQKAEVIGIHGGSVPVEQVLGYAQQAGLETVAIVGVDSDGDLYVASSCASAEKVVYLLQKGNHFILDRFA